VKGHPCEACVTQMKVLADTEEQLASLWVCHSLAVGSWWVKVLIGS